MKKLLFILTIFAHLNSVRVFSQEIVMGKVDTNGFKQGLWKVKHTSHPLVPKKTEVISLCNYVDNKIEGDFYLYSTDSLAYIYKFNAINNQKKGMGFLMQNKKISETYYFLNDTICLIHEFGFKGQLLRVYESIYSVNSNIIFSGDYFDFWKGKMIRHRKYSLKGKLVDEK